MSSVYEYVFIFETEKGVKGIVRADDISDAAERVYDCCYDKVVSIKRATEIENVDFGIILLND